MRRILMVLDKAFPPDVRVENEALSLRDGGYEVGILAISPDDRPAADDYQGCRVFRRRVSRQIGNKMRGLAGSVPLLTHYVARVLRDVHQVFPFDVVHMHDLYLFGAGLRARKQMGIPVVGDLHENWVEALRSYAWSTTFPGRLFVSYDRWEHLEKEWTTTVDALVVVVEEAAARSVEKGVDPKRITVVSNTLNIAEFVQSSLDERILREFRYPLNITYVGGFDLHRGLDVAIQAMPRIVSQLPGSTLVLVGSGRNLPDLKELSDRVGAANDVVFTGWRPAATLRSYMVAADICIVPHRRSSHTDTTVPHKLFQYMHCEKPVVVSDCNPLKRIVDETGAGTVFDDADTDAFASAVLRLGRDPELRRVMGARGRAAVEARFNWRAEAEKLVGMYNRLLGGSHSIIGASAE